MSTGEIVFVVIGAIIAAFGVWRILPRAVFFFAPGAVNGRFEPGRYLTPDKLDYAAEVIEPLEALGYRMAGTLVEQPPLWRKTVETLVMVPDSSDNFLCINISKLRITYYFQTMFTGGEALITADGGFRPVEDGGLHQFVVKTDEHAEVLDRHRDNSENLISEGLTPVPAYTDEMIGGSTRLYYGFPVVRKGMRRYGLNNLILFIILCIPLVIALT